MSDEKLFGSRRSKLIELKTPFSKREENLKAGEINLVELYTARDDNIKRMCESRKETNLKF